MIDDSSHDWKLVFATENEFQSRDEIHQCRKCRLVKHDYTWRGEHTGSGHPYYLPNGYEECLSS